MRAEDGCRTLRKAAKAWVRRDEDNWGERQSAAGRLRWARGRAESGKGARFGGAMVVRSFLLRRLA